MGHWVTMLMLPASFFIYFFYCIIHGTGRVITGLDPGLANDELDPTRSLIGSLNPAPAKGSEMWTNQNPSWKQPSDYGTGSI